VPLSPLSPLLLLVGVAFFTKPRSRHFDPKLLTLYVSSAMEKSASQPDQAHQPQSRDNHCDKTGTAHLPRLRKKFFGWSAGL
jgi:hypothetical protein